MNRVELPDTEQWLWYLNVMNSIDKGLMCSDGISIAPNTTPMSMSPRDSFSLHRDEIIEQIKWDGRIKSSAESKRFEIMEGVIRKVISSGVISEKARVWLDRNILGGDVWVQSAQPLVLHGTLYAVEEINMGRGV